MLLWTAIVSFVGAIILMVIGVCCYRDYRRRQEEVRREGEEVGNLRS